MVSAALSLLLQANGGGGDGGGDKDDETEVFVLTKLGADLDGERMVGFYKSVGSRTDLVLLDPNSRTSLAVLPVYADGGRGCFVNLACNDHFSPQDLIGGLDRLTEEAGNARAFLFGYPHLLPLMQGRALSDMLRSVRSRLGSGCLVGVDLNGVSAENHSPDLLLPALQSVDVLHLNEEEAAVICGEQDDTSALHEAGCAVVLLSLGKRGCRVSVTPDAARIAKCPGQISRWIPGSDVRVPAYALTGGEVNVNGAGDALFAGFCLGASWTTAGRRGDNSVEEGGGFGVSAEEAGKFASLVARQRCDVRTRDGGVGMEGSTELMRCVKTGEMPDSIVA